MTAQNIAAITQGFGDSPICGADKTLQIIFRRKIFSGKPENRCAAFFAVKVADFAQYWNGVKILFCSDASRLTKQVLGKRYPFCQRMGTKAEKFGFPQKIALG